MSSALCGDIARLRRQLKGLHKSKLLFLDETSLRVSAAPSSTLVAPGGTNYIVVKDTSSYAARYDMIACCSGDTVFPPMIFSPADRKEWGQDGISAEMLLDYIERMLARYISREDLYPITLVVDRARIHNIDKMMQAFHDGGCQELQTIRLMPPSAAKRMSPLDNALFNEWKEKIKKRGALSKQDIVSAMDSEWNKLTKESLREQYRKCGLSSRTNPYFDCPDPFAHRHQGAP